VILGLIAYAFSSYDGILWLAFKIAGVTFGSLLGVFLLGLPAHALNVILARAFYSGKDTVTPVSVAVASVVVNVVISLLTVERLGLVGLALGIAVGAWFEAITLTLLLARRHGSITVAPVVRGGLVSLVGALVAALAAAAVLSIVPTLAGSAVSVLTHFLMVLRLWVRR